MGPGPVSNQGSDSGQSCHQPHTLIIIFDIIIITIIFAITVIVITIITVVIINTPKRVHAHLIDMYFNVIVIIISPDKEPR